MNLKKFNKITNWSLCISIALFITGLLSIIGIFSMYQSMSVGSGDSIPIWGYLADLAIFGLVVPVLLVIKIVELVYLKVQKKSA